jgi:hypothetical protein
LLKVEIEGVQATALVDPRAEDEYINTEFAARSRLKPRELRISRGLLIGG